MSRDDKTVVAAEAEALMKNQVLKDAWDSVDKEILRGLKEVNLDGTAEATDYCMSLVHSLQANQRVKTVLLNKITTGKLEGERLARKPKRVA